MERNKTAHYFNFSISHLWGWAVSAAHGGGPCSLAALPRSSHLELECSLERSVTILLSINFNLLFPTSDLALFYQFSTQNFLQVIFSHLGKPQEPRGVSHTHLDREGLTCSLRCAGTPPVGSCAPQSRELPPPQRPGSVLQA